MVPSKPGDPDSRWGNTKRRMGPLKIGYSKQKYYLFPIKIPCIPFREYTAI